MIHSRSFTTSIDASVQLIQFAMYAKMCAYNNVKAFMPYILDQIATKLSQYSKYSKYLSLDAFKESCVHSLVP